MKKLLFGLMSLTSLALMSGCETASTTDILGPAGTPSANTTSMSNAVSLANSADLWPSVAAPDFLQHGTSGEDEYRSAKVSAAKAAGVNCLRINASYGMSDEIAMHLLAFEHPNRAGYYLTTENWFFIAEGRGVTRWIHDLGTPSMSEAERWLYLTKSGKYAGRLQLTCSSATAVDVLARLTLNAVGAAVILY
jgi:hypothetical protein